MHDGNERAHRKHILELITILFIQDALVCKREDDCFSGAHLVSCVPNLQGTQACHQVRPSKHTGMHCQSRPCMALMADHCGSKML